MTDIEARLRAVEERVGILHEEPGKTAIFKCSCGRPARDDALSCGELHVIPIKVEGRKCIDLMTRGSGGVVLSSADRLRLIRILGQQSWFGE